MMDSVLSLGNDQTRCGMMQGRKFHASWHITKAIRLSAFENKIILRNAQCSLIVTFNWIYVRTCFDRTCYISWTNFRYTTSIVHRTVCVCDECMCHSKRLSTMADIFTSANLNSPPHPRPTLPPIRGIVGMNVARSNLRPWNWWR